MNRSEQLFLSDAKKVSDNLTRLFVQKLTRQEYLDSVTAEIAGWTGCSCAGVRLVAPEGYIPYESCRGFSPQFLEKENRLSIKADACACIRVVTGLFKLSDHSAKTLTGSFYCENLMRFHAGLAKDQKADFRGACIEAGFKTICIVPLRYRGEISGTIHLADKREAVIPRNAVEIIESMALLVGEAVYRYKVEKGFQDSERRYRALIENSPCGIYLVQKGKIIFANETFADTHGYSKDEIIGLDSLETVHPADRDAVKEIREKRMKGDESPARYEIRGFRKNGDIIWVLRRNLLIEYDGQMSILGYEVDITEQKQNEYTLTESHELLETIFSNVHFMVAYMDKSFNFIRVNRAYAEADGHTPQFFIGKNHFALYPNTENEQIFRKVIDTGEPYFVYGKAFRYALNHKGETTYWDWSLQPIKDAAGEICGIVMALVNVTDSKRAEEALRKANAELGKRAAQLARLTSELALVEQRERRRLAEVLHDHLQQFLIAAKINSEVLAGQIGAEQKQAAENIIDLISQSLQTSRFLTAELSPPVLQQGSLSAALQWLARWMKEKHGLTVQLQTTPCLDPEREDLTIILFQAARELLLNVVKHAGVKSARVEMSKYVENRLCVSIIDEGTGFDPDTIWEGAEDGGFGLFSIRERLTFLGGNLEIESSPGNGASFSLVVPLATTKEKEEKHIEKHAAELPAFKHSGGKIRILIADDHTVVRQGLSTMLGLHSEVDIIGEAADGGEAVEMIRKLRPDVVLMDISMPGMDGLQATRIIHSEFPHIRIIGLSMHNVQDKAAAMIEAGASAYCTKDGNTNVLLRAILGEAEKSC